MLLDQTLYRYGTIARIPRNRDWYGHVVRPDSAAGDISPTIVASGMKVALITTIFGIIVALILQVFYNYILSKVEHLTSQMEESAVTLMDIIAKNK